MEYDELAWIYVLHQRTNGITTGIYLVVRTKKGKIYSIASATVKNSEELNLIMAEIAERNKDILVGFTPENNKAYKEIVKENK